MSHIEKLLLENKEDYDKIREMEKKIKFLRKKIHERECEMFKKCVHSYVVDMDRTSSDDCKYYCKKCGCWCDKFMYE